MIPVISSSLNRLRANGLLAVKPLCASLHVSAYTYVPFPVVQYLVVGLRRFLLNLVPFYWTHWQLIAPRGSGTRRAVQLTKDAVRWMQTVLLARAYVREQHARPRTRENSNEMDAGRMKVSKILSEILCFHSFDHR